MHISTLAFESVFLASILFVDLAITIAIITAAGRRPQYTWLLAAGFLGLSVYFGLLAITAGAAPIWQRTEMAIWIRAILMVVIVCMAAWGMCLVGEMVRRGRSTQSTLRLALFMLVAVVLAGCTPGNVEAWLGIPHWAIDAGLVVLLVTIVLSSAVSWAALVVGSDVDDRMGDG